MPLKRNMQKGRYSDRLTRLEGLWKKFRLARIPGRNEKGTTGELCGDIQRLWQQLDRPLDAELEGWDINRLYAAWFELKAEHILRERYPSEHCGLRLDEEREVREKSRKRKW